MSFLALKCVSKRYGQTTVFENFSLSVEKGKIVVLLGPSGCGKSTILRMIAGPEYPDAGDILIDGVSIKQIDPAFRPVVLVPQKFGLPRFHTVRRILEMSARKRIMIASRSTNRLSQWLLWVRLRMPYFDTAPKQLQSDIVLEYAKRYEITSFLNKEPPDLSGGQQQRVALARSLTQDAQLLLLDEPLGQLDTALRGTLREQILDLCKKQGRTIVLVTHDMEDARRMADWVVVMGEDGSIQQQGSYGDVFKHPNSQFVATQIGQTNFIAMGG